MHEDPKGRVHRPHPFFHESNHLRPSRAAEPTTMQGERTRNSHATMSATVSQSSTPISSYIAPGFHDAPLPVGKYYPTNYEQSHQQDPQYLRPDAVTDLESLSKKSDYPVPQTRSEASRSENPQMEMRRKMQQYQRDMIAQATMVLGASARTAPPGVSLNGLPIKDIWLSGSASHKPLSPRLHPLGSPGPVTPMELESSGSSYLDSGVKSPPPLTKSGLAPPSAGVSTNSV